MNRRDPWTPALRARWAQIRRHPIGGPLQHAFVARLGREQRWSPAMARKALLEYRRFAFLASIGNSEATPSKAVDAVWHLHLLHTQDYWLDFCPRALGTSLHHNPGGGAHDVARHREQYARTLADYESFFGAAPREIWPRPDAAVQVSRQKTSLRQRIARAAMLVAAAVSPALAWATIRPANPLDWRGPEFLSLYLTLMAIVFVVSLLLRAVLRHQLQPAPRSTGEMSTAEIAYLAGGPTRVVDTAVADLHRRGALAWDASRKRFGHTRHTSQLEPTWRAVANALDAGSSVTQSIGKATRAVEPVRTGLERRGFWFPAEVAHRVAARSALPAAALAAFGVAKIGVGIYRDVPVTILVVLTVITAVFALCQYFARPGRTRAGSSELARLRATAPGRHATGEQLALAVALTGTAVLAGTALASYHDLRAPSSSSSTSSSDSSSSSSDSGSSDSGGGSSCGGCGGGGGD